MLELALLMRDNGVKSHIHPDEKCVEKGKKSRSELQFLKLREGYLLREDERKNSTVENSQEKQERRMELEPAEKHN